MMLELMVFCAWAGLVKLGRVALDGTKVRASASRHKAMSHDRLGPKIEQLEAEVADLLAQAEAADREEDAEFGEDRRGDEVPEELARRQSRLAKLRSAKEAIEQEARDKGEDPEAADKRAHEAAEQAIRCPEARTGPSLRRRPLRPGGRDMRAP